ncbi:MAG: hypothetical protein V1859_11745 [archaeon]
MEERGYYLLLSINAETLRQKVEFCNIEEIDYKLHPRLLILGLGLLTILPDESIIGAVYRYIGEKRWDELGALPRRVYMILNAFPDKHLPANLNYKQNPAVLDAKDTVLERRIERAKIS